MVPTFTANRSTGEVASFAPAASPRLRRSSSPWPPERRDQTDQGVPHPSAREERVRTAIQPRSTGFELAKVLRGFTPLVPRVHLPVSLAGPAPSGSAGASRRCRGCSPSGPVVSPNPTTPSSYRSAATKRRRGSCTLARSHGASWRTAPLLHRIKQRRRHRQRVHSHRIRGNRVRSQLGLPQGQIGEAVNGRADRGR